MPRRESPFLPGHYYHLYNRGHNRQAIFFEQANYVYFLRGIKRYLSGALDIIAYCLMPTHYHLLMRVKEPQTEISASRAMQKIIISYTKAINHRFKRVGALFQGQFQSKRVADESYLVNLCVYIHANPVKDGLVVAPEDWDYSNYREWLGMRDGTMVDQAFIQEHFDTADQYRALMADYLATRRVPEVMRAHLQGLD